MRESGYFPAVPSDAHSLYPHMTGLQDITLYVRPGAYPSLDVEAVRGGRLLSATVTISEAPIIEQGALPPAVGRSVFRFIRANRLALRALWSAAIGNR